MRKILCAQYTYVYTVTYYKYSHTYMYTHICNSSNYLILDAPQLWYCFFWPLSSSTYPIYLQIPTWPVVSTLPLKIGLLGNGEQTHTDMHTHTHLNIASEPVTFWVCVFTSEEHCISMTKRCHTHTRNNHNIIHRLHSCVSEGY